MGLIAGLIPIPETYAGPRAWWPLDTAVHAVTLERDLRGDEMLAAAHIDWDVEKRPVFYPTDVRSRPSRSRGSSPWSAGPTTPASVSCRPRTTCSRTGRW